MPQMETADDSGSPSGPAPMVQSFNPANGAVLEQHHGGDNITVTFDREMDSSSIHTSNITLRDNNSNSVPGLISYDNRVATFESKQPAQFGQLHDHCFYRSAAVPEFIWQHQDHRVSRSPLVVGINLP